MSEPLIVRSHRGEYRVTFAEHGPEALRDGLSARTHVIADERVADLYAQRLGGFAGAASVLRLPAHEDAKSLDRFPDYVAHLVAHGVRRDHVLVALGGGIIQDITSFLAAVLLRGIDWHFFPTTLLAQADSCIGSKSSINAAGAKNIIGTFTPPTEIVLDSGFLATLDERDLRSGIGEILKVHAIDGPASFDTVAGDYDRLAVEPEVLRHYIRRALEIKRGYVERDEFDRGPRNIFNYGHTFGHAIEAATHYAVPHGIGVTIGMDMANFVSQSLGRLPASRYRDMHATLTRNYRGFESHPVPLDAFMAAIAKDKKNVGNDITVITPNAEGVIERHALPNDTAFRELCGRFLDAERVA